MNRRSGTRGGAISKIMAPTPGENTHNRAGLSPPHCAVAQAFGWLGWRVSASDATAAGRLWRHRPASPPICATALHRSVVLCVAGSTVTGAESRCGRQRECSKARRATQPGPNASCGTAAAPPASSPRLLVEAMTPGAVQVRKAVVGSPCSLQPECSQPPGCHSEAQAHAEGALPTRRRHLTRQQLRTQCP